MAKRHLVLIFAVLFLSISLYSADFHVRLNSIGFLPAGAKGVTSAQAATTFEVRATSGGAVVFNGSFGSAINAADSGETLYKGDFTSFSTPGRYYVNVPGVGRSVDFDIADDVYNTPYFLAMRAMYLWRCGMAVSAQHGGNTYSHAACHLNDANQNYIGFGSNIRDGRGGWHDAGDYNKYIVNAGITMGMFFMAWEHFGSVLNAIPLPYLPNTVSGYPEYNVANYPDYLKELRWEMDWVLKMQYPDGTGRVSHKLSTLNFGGFIMPEAETATRYYVDWGSAATADFVAMCAMAARIFWPYDPVFAQRCIDAAWVSYDFLRANTANKNPDQSAFTTGGYTTTDSDDRLWAAAEMWATTGSTTAHQDFTTRANAISDKTDEDFDWGNVKNLGMYTYIMCTRTGKNATVLSQIEAALIADANSIVTRRNNHGYSRPLGTNYYWGCNGAVARQAMLLQIANRLSPNVNYTNAALDALGHLFGRNHFNRSFVTALGINPPMFPHDRPSGADGIAAPWPGYLVGGSPGSGQDPDLAAAVPAGQPPARYWADIEGSYSSNEIAINWQGALVYALAGFVKPPGTPTATRTITRTPTHTPFAGTPTSTSTVTPIPTVGIVLAECVSLAGFTINGNLNESAWQSGTWMNVTRVVEGTLPAPVSAQYKVRWDANNLYIGVDVTDSALFSDSTAALWYNDDSAEVYIDAMHNHTATYGTDDYQFSIRYNDAVLREQNNRTGSAAAATFQTANGYSAEFRIPWADIGVSAGAGTVIGLDVGVNYDQNGGVREGVLMWNGTSNNWQSTAAFGDALLEACVVTPTNTPVNTVTRTATRTATGTATRTHSPTFTNTGTATSTNTVVVPSATPTATATQTATRTNTVVVPSTTPTATATQTATRTNTVVVPSATPTATATQTATRTATFTGTFTPTATLTRTATEALSPTVTNTITETPTGTPPTATVTQTATQTATRTAEPSPTNTATLTATQTPVDTLPPTATNTIPVSATFTATREPSATFTATLIPATPTFTRTRTVTATPTRQATALPSPTHTAVPISEGAILKITSIRSGPNPWQQEAGDLRIDYYLTKGADNVKIKIYTTASRKIYEGAADNPPYRVGYNQSRVKKEVLSRFAPGLYYLVLTAGAGGEKTASQPLVLVVIR